MKKRKIGLDFDDTMFDYIGSVLTHRNELLGTNYTLTDVTTYEFEDIWGVSKDEAEDFLVKFHDHPRFASMDILPDVAESLAQLKPKNDLVVITAREDTLAQITLNSIQKHIPSLISEIYYTNHFTRDPKKEKKTKVQICKDLGIKVLVEDSLVHAVKCAEEGITILMLDKPWNQGKLHPGIIRVKGWQEIVTYISNLPAES